MTMTKLKDKTVSTNRQKRETPNSLGKWVRFSAIMLAAAMLAALIFLVFPIKDRMAQKPNFAALAPTTQVIRSQQTADDDEDLSPAEQMERQDSLFLAATKAIVTPREVKVLSLHKAKTFLKKCHKSTLQSLTNPLIDRVNNDSVAVKQQQLGIESDELLASKADPNPAANQQITEKQDDHIAISTINASDSTMLFNVDGEVLSKMDNHNDVVITQKK